MRYKLVFRDAETFSAGISALSVFRSVITSDAGLFAGIELPDAPDDDVAQTELRGIAAAFRAEVFRDFEYSAEGFLQWPVGDRVGDMLPGVIGWLLDILGIRPLWQISQGAGIDLAIVDYGVDPKAAGISRSRLVAWWPPKDPRPWTDGGHSHGNEVAGIAAALAPASGVMACRSTLADSEIAAFYDFLTTLAQAGRRIVAVNSWGWETSVTPVMPAGAQTPAALERALAAGVMVVFSAGNNHVSPYDPRACRPSTIWLFKSRSDVFTIGAWDQTAYTIWGYSSRGPGEYPAPGTSRKPDICAPVVPLLGTSGACPQAAALIALIWSKVLSLTRDQIHDAIRTTAFDHASLPWECEGAGLINPSAALSVYP